MATVDDLLSAFPAGSAASAPMKTKAEDLLAAFNAPVSPPAPAPAGFWETMMHKASDGANAVATGFNRGIAGLAGLPTDTVANVVDLGKAGLGGAYIAATGKEPPDYLQLQDRSKYFGTSANILDKISNAPPLVSGFVNAQNPEYQGGYLQNAGTALASAMQPYKSPAQMGQGILMNQASGAASKAAYDVTGSPSAAIAAGLLPTAAANIGVAATKYAVRGGEDGRQNVIQRTQDLENAGITQPSVGLATGNKTIGGVENLLASTPGAMGVMAKARAKALAGMQTTTENAADLAAPEALRGSRSTGIGINNGVQQFADQFKQRQQGLYDNLDQFIPPETPVTLGNTTNALDKLNAPIPGAPATSKMFQNARIAGIQGNLSQDLEASAAARNASMVPGTPLQGEIPVRPAGPLAPGVLPYQALKQTRTLVGNELADAGPFSDVPRSKWRPLYGALSGDMQNAAEQAGPGATSALNRANDYTSAGLDRLGTVEGFASPNTSPEQSFNAVKSTLGDNASLFNTLKKSLPQGVRGQIAGTVIDQLGTSTPGQQNDTGTAWSPERFLTNWNRMSPSARDGLLSGFPNSDQVATDVGAVAKAASMMRDNSGLWANPSGTAAALGARGTIGAAAYAAATGHPLIAAGVGGSLVGTNLTARALTSKWAVDALKNKTEISPQQLQAAMQTLAARGLLQPENNPNN